MRQFAVWTSLVFALGACGSDPEPSSDGATAAGSGGGSGATAAGAGASAAGSSGGAAGAAASGRGGSVGSAGRAGSAAGSGGAGSGSAGRAAGAAGSAGASAGSGGSSAGRGGSGGAAGAAGSGEGTSEKFSFFVTSLSGMLELSGSDQGFGGNFKYGGANGLAGADNICTALAEKSMPGSGAKGWRAFLSTAKGGPSDGPIHARERIGKGPWYDRIGRLVATDVTALTAERPTDADSAIRNDLPNERGEPNHTDTMANANDNHDTVTGSNQMGMFDSQNGNTCGDWTSTETSSGGKGPMVGHSWPGEQSGKSWIRAHNAPGCAPSVALVQMGGGSGTGIGNGGGYGGIYCFALKP